MDRDKRRIYRAFYQTLAADSGVVTPAQVDFYKMVLKGDVNSRKAWAATYARDLTALDPAVVALLTSAATLSQEDIAIIAASAVAPVIAEKTQGLLSRILASIFAWLKK